MEKIDVKLSVYIEGDNCSDKCVYYLESFCKLFDIELVGIKRCLRCKKAAKDYFIRGGVNY